MNTSTGIGSPLGLINSALRVIGKYETRIWFPPSLTWKPSFQERVFTEIVSHSKPPPLRLIIDCSLTVSSCQIDLCTEENSSRKRHVIPITQHQQPKRTNFRYSPMYLDDNTCHPCNESQLVKQTFLLTFHFSLSLSLSFSACLFVFLSFFPCFFLSRLLLIKFWHCVCGRPVMAFEWDLRQSSS